MQRHMRFPQIQPVNMNSALVAIVAELLLFDTD
jgi:hypothetical protein